MLKPCAKSMRRAFVDVADDLLVQRLLREVRRQEGDERCAFDGFSRLGHPQPVLLRFRPAVAASANADDDVEATVLEVERVCATLTAVAEDRDARTLQSLLADVLLRINLHVRSSGVLSLVKTKQPRLGLAGAGSVLRIRGPVPTCQAPILHRSGPSEGLLSGSGACLRVAQRGAGAATTETTNIGRKNARRSGKSFG